MARPLRGTLPDGIYHVTARAVADDALFRDDGDHLIFLRLLSETAERACWRCHAFCLMGTHYHLVLETTRLALSRGVHRLNGLYVQLFNRRHSRRGHVFGDRFHAWLLDDEEHFHATCRYVIQNPVRAGLCERAEDWPWSSLRTTSRPR